jgi:hypothetical protein
MARLAAGLLEETHDLKPERRDAIAGLVAEVGRGAIFSTLSASGHRYELTTHVPTGALGGAARLSGALWRIALSPLLSPPFLPPLPLPPPHIAPPALQSGALPR